MRRHLTRSSPIFVLLSVLLAGPVSARMPPDEKVRMATEVYRELLEVPEKEVPQELLEASTCVAIIPGVIKGAFGWGGRHGRGVLSCRDDTGQWSPVVFVSLSGGSFGLQIGAQSTDIVLFFMNERSVRSLLKSKFTLGGDLSVAAGPLGRSAEIGTDLMLRAEIYSYAKSRGLFAGMSLEGARMAPHKKAIARYYRESVAPEDLLFGRWDKALPAESRQLLEALP